MSNYQPFLVSEFKTGLYDYLKPWIRPADAFEPLTNAFVYRGILQKRKGSAVFGNQLVDKDPVMGIMQYQNESNGTVKLVVATTRNAYLYLPSTSPNGGTFSPLTTIGGPNSTFWQGTVVNATGAPVTQAIPGTLDTFWQNLVPLTSAPSTPILITATDLITNTTVGTIADNGTILTGGTGIFTSNNGTIVYATGKITLNITIPANTTYNLILKLAATTTVAGQLTGDYFTGDITNFFNWTNWQPTSSLTSQSTSYLYMINNKDPLTIFDGTNLARPILYTDSTYSSHNFYIITALDVKTYANRLILLRPTTTESPSTPANQDIAYSARFNPFNFVGDIAGNGGAISAATGDTIISGEFLRDNLIVAFSNSTWTFQVTGLTEPPFIFRKISVARSAQCPYASVPYDERVTNLGNTGFYATDGVNVQRYDLSIIDFYENEINQKYYNQNFSQRYDNINQTWMFYPSRTNEFFALTGLPASDKTLIYNYLENTWATYENSYPMTCMGFFYVPQGTTWADLPQPWQDTDEAWNDYDFQSSGRMLLGGDLNGNIYQLDDATSVLDGMKSPVAELIATGNGGQNYSGTTVYHPIIAGTFVPTDGIESFVDVGDGTLTGSAGGSGTINYATGAWTLHFNAGVANATPITSNYSAGASFNIDVKTTRWNPFMQTGQKTQFGYIDVFYSSASVNPLNPIAITLNFYVDNSNDVVAKRTLTLDGPKNSPYAWKRIYCNLTGEFIQITFDPTENSYFEILGFVLWARPAGRLTP